MLQKRVNLFGLLVDDVDLAKALSFAENSLGDVKARVFFTPNLEMLSAAYRSEGARRMLSGSDVSLPDGFGLKIVSGLLGEPLENTVPGIDFGEGLLRLASQRGDGVFLLGGREGVAERAAQVLSSKYRKLRICGVHHGYFGDDEAPLVCEKINASGARILIVCRGFPRQEKFVSQYRDVLPCAKVFACLGGSLDVWSGDVRRAPAIIRKAHLEWLWRIILEPERLTRFVCSLDVISAAIRISIRKILSFRGMKARAGEYN